MKKKSNNDLSFKIITIGDTGVGKTSIIRRYLFNTFEYGNFTTIGVNFSFKDVTLKNGKVAKIKLIDTAGQEKYKSLSKSYYKNAEGVLFVFAKDNEESFKNISEWIKLFDENNSGKEGIPKYLIGNKDDLEGEITVKEDSIESFLKENNGYEYRSVSALKDDNRIDDLFQDMAEKLYHNFKEGKQNSIQLEENKNKYKKRRCQFCNFSGDDV